MVRFTMDLDQLHTFLEIVRLKSFSKAAQTCYRTQPAISAQVRQLEQELNTTLFERLGTKIALTAAGKIFAMVLEAENAISKWRDTMGATDPKKAAPGTIRRDLGTNIGNNCTHGSDAQETAAFEISYFFAGHELI